MNPLTDTMITVNANTSNNYQYPTVTLNSNTLINSKGTSTINSGNWSFTTGSQYSILNTNLSGIVEVNGEDADLKINGKSLKTFMEKVEERLLILQPDPAKLEKYQALRKAYEHYKLMEKLIGE